MKYIYKCMRQFKKRGLQFGFVFHSEQAKLYGERLCAVEESLLRTGWDPSHNGSLYRRGMKPVVYVCARRLDWNLVIVVTLEMFY